MSDDFDKLKAALQANPAPDAAARAQALAQAMENFDALQGSPLASRPREDRPARAGIIPGVKAMLTAITGRPWLAATTSAAALAVGMVVFLPVAESGRMRDAEPALAPGEADLKLAAPQDKAPLAGQTDTGATTTTADARQAPATQPAKPELAEETLQREADGLAQHTLGDAESAIAGDTLAAAPAPSVVGLAAPLEQARRTEPNTEAFANDAANPVRITAEGPVSTFSIDVDTASYAVVRSSLNAGQLPVPEAVRIEEMVNYFPYDTPAPPAGQAFRPTITVLPTPWNAGTRLVHVAIQGALPAVAERPALNLVFLIDTSGSMEDANKLPLLKQSFALMLGALRPTDQVSIVTYAGSAGQVLPPTPASDREAILAALERLAAGGGTAGAEGIELAYRVAEGMKSEGEVSRVILATDGDFNLGISDPEALKSYIESQRETGTYLSVLGFGRGNLDDATMQALAQNGNGTAAYVDTLGEARKVMVDQVTGALFPIANNVKIQVEWNPAEVAEYRLIGYETRALAREDFNNDKVDAGDIGAGTSVTAIYEITAPDSPALLNDPLRYQAAGVAEGSGELGYLRIRAVKPGETVSEVQETAIVADTGQPGEDARFAVAIAGFGQLLTGAKYTGDWGWDAAIDLALGARGEDAFGYRIEAVNLMRLAQGLSGH